MNPSPEPVVIVDRSFAQDPPECVRAILDRARASDLVLGDRRTYRRGLEVLTDVAENEIDALICLDRTADWIEGEKEAERRNRANDGTG